MQGAVLPREGELIETSAWVGLPGPDAGLREGTSVERAGVSQTVWLELLFLKKKIHAVLAHSPCMWLTMA